MCTQRSGSSGKTVDVQVLEPSDTFLLFDRHPRWVDVQLELVRALELLPRPEFDCSQSERQPVGGHRKAGMHENAACGVTTRRSISMGAGDTDAGLADRFDVVTLVCELSRVGQNQHRTVCRCESLASGVEMTCQNLGLVHPIVGEEPIRRLGIRSVLAHQRNALARRARKLIEQTLEALPQPLIREITPFDFLLSPSRRFDLASDPPPDDFAFPMRAVQPRLSMQNCVSQASIKESSYAITAVASCE